MKASKNKSFLLLIVLLTCLVAGQACGSLAPKAKVFLTSAPVINESNLLTVDILMVGETDKRTILQIGAENWWESPTRRGFTPPARVTKTLRGGESAEISIEGPKGAETIIIFAEYRGVTDPEAQQIVLPISEAGKKIHVYADKDRLVLNRM